MATHCAMSRILFWLNLGSYSRREGKANTVDNTLVDAKAKALIEKVAVTL